MAGKILFVEDALTFVEDELTKLEGTLIGSALKNLGILGDDGKLNANCYGVVEFANGFRDAVEKIINAGDGADYSWFFLDRNLECFSDVKNGKKITVKLPGGDQIVFSEVFFQCFKSFEGDYLYFLLRKAGVPIEKICFLTGNDPSSDKKSLQSTPFVFGEKTPEVIVKLKPDPNQVALGFVNDDRVKIENSPDADVVALVEKIGNTPQVQLRCRYSEIFKNETKLNNIFGNDIINRFLGVLEKIEKGQTQKDDGVVFRNMVEKICSWLWGPSIRAIEPRAFMNNIDTQNDFAYSLNYKNFEFAYKHLLSISMKKKTWRNRLPEWKDLQDDLDNNVELLPGADAADTAALLCYLNYYLQDCKDIPKYFIACLDHVYTLTSEFSAHGKSDIDVNDIPWRALADDMITILKWCVGNQPPQKNITEVTLHFKAKTWSPQDFVKGTEVTLKTVKGGIQNQKLPRGTIEKIESV